MPFNPNTSTGTDGFASVTVFPWSLIKALTLPHCSPTTKISPLRSVPFLTSTVATGPRPVSSLASMTAPCAARSGLAFNSSNSDCNAIASNNPSSPVPLRAEISTSCTSPDIASTTTECCKRSVLTRIGSAAS